MALNFRGPPFSKITFSLGWRSVTAYILSVTVTFEANTGGTVIVPDPPAKLPPNARLRVTVVQIERPNGSAVEPLARLPLIALSPENAQAINLDPEFAVEES